MDGLREQLLINKFVMVAGCHSEQAKQLLISAKWHLEAALSMFFQDSTAAQAHVQCCHCNGNSASDCHFPMCTPANTPVTPPHLPDTLLAFSRLSTTTTTTSAATSADPSALVPCSSTLGNPMPRPQAVPVTMCVPAHLNSAPKWQEQ